MVHFFDTPNENTAYTATFKESQVTPCQADVNQDTIVDLSDYSLVIKDFLKLPLSNLRSDIDGDGITDLTDHSFIMTYFFERCES